MKKEQNGKKFKTSLPFVRLRLFSSKIFAKIISLFVGKADPFLRNMHFLAETGYCRKSFYSFFFFLSFEKAFFFPRETLVEKDYSVSVEDKTLQKNGSIN